MAAFDRADNETIRFSYILTANIFAPIVYHTLRGGTEAGLVARVSFAKHINFARRTITTVRCRCTCVDCIWTLQSHGAVVAQAQATRKRPFGKFYVAVCDLSVCGSFMIHVAMGALVNIHDGDGECLRLREHLLNLFIRYHASLMWYHKNVCSQIFLVFARIDGTICELSRFFFSCGSLPCYCDICACLSQISSMSCETKLTFNSSSCTHWDTAVVAAQTRCWRNKRTKWTRNLKVLHARAYMASGSDGIFFCAIYEAMKWKLEFIRCLLCVEKLNLGDFFFSLTISETGKVNLEIM